MQVQRPQIETPSGKRGGSVSGSARPNLFAVAILALVTAVLAAPSQAQELAQERAQELQRTVLALYDGDAGNAVDETRIHRIAEMPLNHMGYRLIYHDIATGMPEHSDSGTFDHVLTWFDRPIALERALLDWARREVARGTRFAILGDPGLRDHGGTGEFATAYLRLFGLRNDGFVSVTYSSRVTQIDDAFVGFEHPLDPVLDPFPLLSPLDAGLDTLLAIETDYQGERRESSIITIGPNGGYAPLDYILFEEDSLEDPQQGRVKWILNPFRFFARVYDRPRAPVPDVTTRAGRRIVISQVDGDGWNNLTRIDTSGSATPRRSAQVILEDIIRPNPGLAVSVGVIGADVDPAYVGDDHARQIARDLFALDHVEVAAHGYSHPYSWRFFHTYDAEQERVMSDTTPGSVRSVTPLTSFAHWSARVLDLERYIPEHSRPVAASAVLPRAYALEPFTLEHEIVAALEMASALAPPSKPARLFQWTGDGEPYAEAIRATRLAGVQNINGGENRYDAVLPSIVYLSPILRVMSGEVQVYAPNTNEIFYTNDWSGPFFGHALVAQTVARTGTPVRFKPYDLYYHMYSGERLASMAALSSLVALALSDEFISMRASDYARLATDFPDMRLVQTAAETWRIDNRGALHTVRLDDPDGLRPDPLASRGYLGARLVNGSLYVALDPAASSVELAFTRAPVTAPELEESSWDILALDRRDCGFSAIATGFGEGAMHWSGLPDGQLTAQVERDGRPLWSQEINVVDGHASLRIPVHAVHPLRLTLGCSIERSEQ